MLILGVRNEKQARKSLQQIKQFLGNVKRSFGSDCKQMNNNRKDSNRKGDHWHLS